MVSSMTPYGVLIYRDYIHRLQEEDLVVKGRPEWNGLIPYAGRTYINLIERRINKEETNKERIK